MKDKELQEQLKKLRTQAKYQIIILLSSLLLIYLWFTYLSFILHQNTFSRGATLGVSEMAAMDVSFTIPIVFILAIFFTILYAILLEKFAPTLKKRYLKK